MENKITAEEYVSSIVNPIFNKVLKEARKNPMSVGRVGSENKHYCIYHPHNYRTYFDFDKTKFNPNPPKGGRLGRFDIINSKEYRLKGFLNCTVTVKKTKIEIRNYIEADRKFTIEMTTNAPETFKEIIFNKDNQCKEVLKEFIRAFGGDSKYILCKRWCENKLWNETSIDAINPSFKWDNKISKKIYDEHNVEFKTPMGAANYVSNRAIEEVAPQVSDKLGELSENIKGVSSIAGAIQDHTKIMFPLRILKGLINSVDDLLKNKHLVKMLNEAEKKELEGWLFLNVG